MHTNVATIGSAAGFHIHNAEDTSIKVRDVLSRHSAIDHKWHVLDEKFQASSAALQAANDAYLKDEQEEKASKMKSAHLEELDDGNQLFRSTDSDHVVGNDGTVERVNLVFVRDTKSIDTETQNLKAIQQSKARNKERARKHEEEVLRLSRTRKALREAFKKWPASVYFVNGGDVEVSQDGHQSAIQAVDDKLSAKISERKDILRSAISAEDQKARHREDVARWAALGEPDIRKASRPQGGPTQFETVRLESSGPYVRTIVDPLPLIAWLIPEILIAKLEATVDATADPTALTLKERTEALAKLDAEILSLEREASAVFWDAIAKNVSCQFPTELRDVRAILCLSDDFKLED